MSPHRYRHRRNDRDITYQDQYKQYTLLKSSDWAQVDGIETGVCHGAGTEKQGIDVA